MSAENDNTNITIFSNFTKNILNSHKSIRYIGIVDQNGITINEKLE